MVRRARRRRLDYSAGVVDELLSPNLTGALELLSCRFPPGASSGEEPYTHSGEEAGVVIRGRLELWVDGRTVTARGRRQFRLPERAAASLSQSRPRRDGGDLGHHAAELLSMSRLANLWEETAVAAPRTQPLDGADARRSAGGRRRLSRPFGGAPYRRSRRQRHRPRSRGAGLWRLRPQWRTADSGTQIRSRCTSRRRSVASAARGCGALPAAPRISCSASSSGSASRRRLAAPPGSRASIRGRPRSGHAPRGAMAKARRRRRLCRG